MTEKFSALWLLQILYTKCQYIHEIFFEDQFLKVKTKIGI